MTHKYYLLFVVLYLVLGAEIYIYEPQQNERFIAYPQHDNKVTLPVYFEIFGSSGSTTTACIELFNQKTNTYALDSSCIETTKFNLNNISPGEYIFRIYLPNDVMASKLERHVKVIGLNEAVPTLSFPDTSDKLLTVAYNEKEKIRVRYQLSDSIVPKKNFRACVQLQDEYFHSIVKSSCFASHETEIILSMLQLGTYHIVFDITSALTPFTVFPQAQQILDLKIQALDALLPSFYFSRVELDYAIKNENDRIELIDIPFQIEGYLTATSQVQPCFELKDMAAERIIIQLTCLAEHARISRVSHLGSGVYEAIFYLRLLQPPNTVFVKTASSVSIIIKPSEEFVPSYEWQPLKAWHTIPAGLETRLPLSESMRKEARIPSPWKMQLHMPEPCRYFLRREVSRDTTVRDILVSAAKRCKKPLSCFRLRGDGSDVSDEESVEVSGLFNKRLELILSPDCSDAS